MPSDGQTYKEGATWLLLYLTRLNFGKFLSRFELGSDVHSVFTSDSF